MRIKSSIVNEDSQKNEGILKNKKGALQVFIRKIKRNEGDN